MKTNFSLRKILLFAAILSLSAMPKLNAAARTFDYRTSSPEEIAMYLKTGLSNFFAQPKADLSLLPALPPAGTESKISYSAFRTSNPPIGLLS